MLNEPFCISRSGEMIEKIAQNPETLYLGRNGKPVERISIIRNGKTETAILKYLTNYENIGREAWVYDSIVPRLSTIRAPELLSVSNTADPEFYWLLFEDLGDLTHSFDADFLCRIAALMPLWHLLPVELVPAPYEGHTPKLEPVHLELASRQSELKTVLLDLHVENRLVDRLLNDMLKEDPDRIAGENVICHGDLNPLNISFKEQQLIVFDWEYIQRNSVFWDLFNLIDITSPVYRRKVFDMDARCRIITAYIKERKKLNRPVNGDFVTHYHVFSAIYTAWILLLIDSDLRHGRFERESLLLQREEASAILRTILLY